MSRKDDDWVYLAALYWMMIQDEEEKKKQQEFKVRSGPESDDSGCMLWIFGIALLMFLAKWQHPYADAARIVYLLFLIYMFGWIVAKFCLRFLVSFIGANIIGGFVLLLVNLLIGDKFLTFIDIVLIVMAYIGGFLYVYRVTCPWITLKAREKISQKIKKLKKSIE